MEYNIKQLFFDDTKELSDILSIMQLVYPKTAYKFSIEKLKWLYLDNPVGRVVSFNAFYGDLLVAHYACTPIIMTIGGKQVKGLLDINTVTHPDHRGKGLFTRLAKETFEYAKNNGFEYILGVANNNSIHGYMKYFNFTFISKLDVKIGFGTNIHNNRDKTYSMYWNKELLEWRCKSPIYSIYKNSIVGKTDFLGISNVLGIKTLMGIFDKQILDSLNLKRSSNVLRPINLYIGLGASLEKGYYFNVPSFIKHSPFNLIFLDLTGKLPPIDKNNLFFQLIDFDVA